VWDGIGRNPVLYLFSFGIVVGFSRYANNNSRE